MHKKKWTLNLFSFRKIDNVEECLHIIKDTFWGFMVVGLLHILLAIFLSFVTTQQVLQLVAGFLIDAVVFIVLALIYYFKKSRVAAVLLLIVSTIGIVSTVLNRLGLGEGGRNVILAIFMFLISIQSVRAVFSYHRLKPKSKVI